MTDLANSPRTTVDWEKAAMKSGHVYFVHESLGKAPWLNLNNECNVIYFYKKVLHVLGIDNWVV